MHVKEINLNNVPLINSDEEEQTVLFARSQKRIFTDRENDLENLVRKRGLSVEQIVERSNATAEEILWMWQRDRDELKVLKRNTI